MNFITWYDGSERMESQRRILVLYWHDGPLKSMRAAIRRHLKVLDGHDVIYFNIYRGAASWLKRLEPDAIVLHTTFLCARWFAEFHEIRSQLEWVKNSPAVKIALPQDEYDHSDILDEWLDDWGVQEIFSCFGSDVRSLLYPRMSGKARFHEILTGYFEEKPVRPVRPIKDRPFDVVYRATRLPYWFGSHGQLKHRVAEVFEGRGLTCDISTRPEDTIVGDRWFDFLASGRVVIGAESGSSVLDRRGEIREKIRSMPKASFEEVSRNLPAGWDDYRFFAISPRHLEAIVSRTCQVLVEGRYSGILEPDRHYIPLKRDFSNVPEVIEKIRDHAFLQRMADQSYEDLFVNRKLTYATLRSQIEKVLPESRGGSRSTWTFGRLRTWLKNTSISARRLFPLR